MWKTSCLACQRQLQKILLKRLTLDDTDNRWLLWFGEESKEASVCNKGSRHVVRSGPSSLWTWQKLRLPLQLSCTAVPRFALGLGVPDAAQQERFSLCPVKPELLFSPAMSPGLFLIQQWRPLPKAIPQASRGAAAAEVGAAYMHAWAHGRAALASEWWNGFTKRWEEEKNAGQCGGWQAWKMILVTRDYIPPNMSLWSWDRTETIELFLSSPSFPANLSHSHVYYLWVLHGWSIFSSRKQTKAVFGKDRLCKVLLSRSSFSFLSFKIVAYSFITIKISESKKVSHGGFFKLKSLNFLFHLMNTH